MECAVSRWAGSWARDGTPRPAAAVAADSFRKSRRLRCRIAPMLLCSVPIVHNCRAQRDSPPGYPVDAVDMVDTVDMVGTTILLTSTKWFWMRRVRKIHVRKGVAGGDEPRGRRSHTGRGNGFLNGGDAVAPWPASGTCPGSCLVQGQEVLAPAPSKRWL